MLAIGIREIEAEFLPAIDRVATMLIIAIIHPRMLELPIDDRVDRSSSHVYRTTGSAVLAIPGV